MAGGPGAGAAALELEHVIGFTGRFQSTLQLHPRHETGLVYALGASVVLGDVTDPHEQIFLRKHDATVSALDLSPSGALLASGQLRQPTVRARARDHRCAQQPTQARPSPCPPPATSHQLPPSLRPSPSRRPSHRPPARTARRWCSGTRCAARRCARGRG